MLCKMLNFPVNYLVMYSKDRHFGGEMMDRLAMVLICAEALCMHWSRVEWSPSGHMCDDRHTPGASR